MLTTSLEHAGPVRSIARDRGGLGQIAARAAARLRECLRASLLVLVSAGCTQGDGGPAPSAALEFRDVPFKLAVARLHLVGLDTNVLQQCTDRLQFLMLGDKSRKRIPSDFVHALRLSGASACIRIDDDNTLNCLAALRHAPSLRQVFGSEMLFKTRFGARYRSPSGLYFERVPGYESHVSQLLATLAESGVGADQSCELSGNQQSNVAALVSDCAALYDIQHSEPEWTALALLLYLAPEARWETRIGNTLTVTDVVAALLDRPPALGSCNGTHTLYVLLCSLQVARSDNRFPTAVGERLLARARDTVTLLTANQHELGYWPASWHTTNRGTEAAPASFLATSHLAECMLYLPEELRPGGEVYRRAATWLWSESRRIIESPLAKDHTCPLTHALAFVKACAQD